jgi:hypothetical protein
MKWIRNPTTFTSALIITFFLAWLYTEIVELIEQAEFKKEFKHFHDEGGRFTSDDGAIMRDKMELMQEQVDLLIQVEALEHPELRDE